jgi:iron complex outermembrane receptor protein
MFYRSIFAATAACSSLCGLAAQAASASLDEVIVSATILRESQLLEVPASITVLTEQSLKDSGQQHFQDVLSQAPNLNWAAGSSRPRYFQIRGIGEREQYQGAPNSSVGFLIDDIDFSGIGMAATLFDVEQIEVLRGPQGTRYGANALGGLIAVRSAEPSNEFGGFATADVGNYDTLGAGVVMTGPAEQWNSAWRLAVQKQRSDGFRDNVFLGRDDTNDRDETTARGKWRWFASEHSQLDLTFLHSNIDNGYDAFSIDNSRNTLSDDPGEDSQRANAGSIKWQSTFESGTAFTALASLVNATSVHAYDGDWGNEVSWSPYTYDYVYRAERARQSETLELRLSSSPLEGNGIAWLGGVYVSNLRESIDELSQGTFVDPDDAANNFDTDDQLASRFGAKTIAIFGQLDGRFAERWTWSGGLRGEHRQAEYRDDAPTDTDRNDTMGGGQVSLSYDVTERARFYSSISRGYKAGGFNLGSARERREEFEPEYLWNYEVGYKAAWLDGRLYFDSSLFYMQRKNMQVRSGEQLREGDPNSYVFVTSNVASGRNYGLESTLRWQVDTHLEVGASLGLLRTEESGVVDDAGQAVESRSQAHSPEYQAQLNLTYRIAGWMARVDFSAVDEFYFDVPLDHDQRSERYQLINLKVGYEADHWNIHAWSRNVADEQYATRGFYFGNEPPAWEDKLYIQNGDPRQFGLTAEWHF